MCVVVASESKKGGFTSKLILKKESYFWDKAILFQLQTSVRAGLCAVLKSQWVMLGTSHTEQSSIILLAF